MGHLTSELTKIRASLESLQLQNQSLSRQMEELAKKNAVPLEVPKKRTPAKKRTYLKTATPPSFLDRKTAEKIWEGVRNVSGSRREPNLSKWAEDIRKLKNREKVSDSRILEVFNFANTDSFWKTNVLSAGGLSKHWVMLSARVNSKAEEKGDDHSTFIRNLIKS